MYELFKYLKETENREIPLVIRIKYNIDLYYKDKSKIEDKEVLKILDKAYGWLYNFLTDDLNNLEIGRVNSFFYDFKYYKDDVPILAYDKKNNVNDNFWLEFKIHMWDYLKDKEILMLIIHKYLTNILNMKGSETRDNR